MLLRDVLKDQIATHLRIHVTRMIKEQVCGRSAFVGIESNPFLSREDSGEGQRSGCETSEYHIL